MMKKMTIADRQRTMAIARRLGVTIDVNHDNIDDLHELTAEAPRGFHWSDGCHEMVVSRSSDRESMESLWEVLADRMENGLEPCDDQCEWWCDQELK